MEGALQARPSGTIEPLCFEKAHAALYLVDDPILPSSSLCPITTSAAPKQTTAMPQDPSQAPTFTQETQEEECLVDSQPICFKENPFLVANRKGKGLPLEERILSGPPTGYGRQGQLQTWLYNKASPWAPCFFWKQHGLSNQFSANTCKSALNNDLCNISLQKNYIKPPRHTNTYLSQKHALLCFAVFN